jgi:hypothetical protein
MPTKRSIIAVNTEDAHDDHELETSSKRISHDHELASSVKGIINDNEEDFELSGINLSIESQHF